MFGVALACQQSPPKPVRRPKKVAVSLFNGLSPLCRRAPRRGKFSLWGRGLLLAGAIAGLGLSWRHGALGLTHHRLEVATEPWRSSAGNKWLANTFLFR